MSIYSGKLLELKEIKNEYDKYFLQVRLSFEQDIEMFWEIDKYTAENLKDLIQFDEKHKYRLSFNSSWDVIQKQHKSVLTRTYRDQSDIISFSCSEDYISKLNTIKHCQDIAALDKPIFIPINLESTDELHKDEEKISKNYIGKFKMTSIAIMSVIFVILFGYLSRLYLNKTAFDEKALAQSIQLNNEMTEKQSENLESENSIAIEDLSSIESVIPFIKLEESITYSVPEGNVALTFDDGPSQYSIGIMDVLKKYGVGGTFFFTGLNVKKYPDYVQCIQSNGYSIGSHSMNHINMPTLSYDKQKSELIDSIELLEEVTNQKITLFRPPYGSLNKQIKDLIYNQQYKIVLWNNDPEDWKTQDADKIFYSIQNSNVSGSIILLHESQAVIDALPRIIEYLQELNLEIISLK
ncbi:polysaccharide deacetylase family protein [Tissierella carlieri]|uniref:Polysaccharide deacetylase family protein n=1 Tax=Tissierella carlieri TaxID=689904 RepID=A0ABT1SDT0_9FIRM|nr:polysaccharide deacetylase family protein [Tissierella carlieri]MCQ4924625.1 polysaccharide deacetylase family protein [Tissierella carlieri]